VVLEILLADRLTDRHTDTQTYSLQYLSTSPAGKVLICSEVIVHGGT